MGEQMKQMGMGALKYLPDDCKEEALKVLEHRRLAFDVKGIPSVVKGYHLHPNFEEECLQYAYDHVDLKKGDVLIAAFPKTGTTWLQAVVQHILHHKNPEELEKYTALRRFVFYLEFGPASKYKIWEKLDFPQQMFATHLPAPLVNLKKYTESGAKVIHIIRNPKDQAVSWRNFTISFPYTKLDHWKPLIPQDDEKEFYDLYLAGKQYNFAKEGEGYLEHTKEWYQYKNDDNFLFLVFEDMKKDPKKEIKKIAEFIGHPLSDEELNKVVEETSFTAMKETLSGKGFDSSKGVTFFRKGQVGSWKAHLTVAQSEFIDRKVEEVLGGTGIKFIYE